MGVSGCGKTTLGEALSQSLEIPFLDADDFHPAENISKMSQGNALTDSDRMPWLTTLNTTLHQYHKQEGAILACSALKEQYRVILSYKLPVQWVYLKGDFDLIFERMQARKHFMPPHLLQSQFDSLEVPSYGLHLDATNTVQEWVAQVNQMAQQPAHFGIIGLGVMGKSLAFNALSKGIPLAVYNRATQGEEKIVANFIDEANTALCNGFTQLEAFVAAIKAPRKILLMVPAGAATQAVIDNLAPLLTGKDTIIDGGNAYFKNTQQRTAQLKEQNLHYVGLGVSGGQEGALRGPSLMPGGDKDVINSIWELTAMAAKVNNEACANYMGPDGAGHFVKMIHNGIEYAEMQLLAESYDVLKAAGYTTAEIAALYEAWQGTNAQSYLLGIMPDILRKQEKGAPLITLIQDAASGKGTGVWSAKNALDYGQPSTMITAAVNARFSSSQRYLRKTLAATYPKTAKAQKLDIHMLFNAYTTARLVNHYQGLALIKEVSNHQNWNTSLAAVTQNWRAGCILKSKLVEQLAVELATEDALAQIPSMATMLSDEWTDLQHLCKLGIETYVPLPCFNAALTHLYAVTQEQSSANIIQAQRDYFGAHGYKRTDMDNDQLHHTNWKQK